MVNKLKNLVEVVVFGLVSAGLTSGIIESDKKHNPMSYAPEGYVIVRDGDSIEKLYSQEGWSEENIRAFSPSNRNISYGDIVEIPQHPQGDNLRVGESDRFVYETREEAEKMRKQLSAYGF